MLEIKKIQNKGRGVITKQDVSKGTLLEVAPVTILPKEQIPSINQTEVFKYYFVQPLEYEKSNHMKAYLVFGLASLCNHAENPNAHIEWIENDIGLWSHLLAKRDIEKGEEVTLFYTNIDEYTHIGQFI